MDDEDFEMVRHIAAKSLVEDDRVDVEGMETDDLENALVVAAADASSGVYVSLD